jgi:hypothetical protein
LQAGASITSSKADTRAPRAYVTRAQVELTSAAEWVTRSFSARLAKPRESANRLPPRTAVLVTIIATVTPCRLTRYGQSKRRPAPGTSLGVATFVAVASFWSRPASGLVPRWLACYRAIADQFPDTGLSHSSGRSGFDHDCHRCAQRQQQKVDVPSIEPLKSVIRTPLRFRWKPILSVKARSYAVIFTRNSHALTTPPNRPATAAASSQ